MSNISKNSIKNQEIQEQKQIPDQQEEEKKDKDVKEQKESPGQHEGDDSLLGTMPGAAIINHFLQWLRNKGLLKVSPTLLTFVIGLGWLFAMEIPDHHQKARSEAWNLINSASEQSGDGGRTSALEDLNEWSNKRTKWNIPFISDLILGKEIKLETVKASNANLSQIQLQEAVLNYANFQDSQLWNANLEKAKLKNANFQRAILSGTNLNEADLQGANLNSSNLSCFKKDEQPQDQQDIKPKCTELIGANLAGAKLIGTNLIDANLTKANLTDTDFTRSVYTETTKFPDSYFPEGAYLIKPGINLSGADLIDVNLRGADLRGVKLIGANLSGTDLREANLQNADLSRIVYTETTKFPDSYSPKDGYLIKPGVNLSYKNLRGVNLNNANLVGVNLTGADLTGTILTDANLTNAQLKDATLQNANLKNANLENAKNLCNTKMLDEKIEQSNCK